MKLHANHFNALQMNKAAHLTSGSKNIQQEIRAAQQELRNLFDQNASHDAIEAAKQKVAELQEQLNQDIQQAKEQPYEGYEPSQDV